MSGAAPMASNFFCLNKSVPARVRQRSLATDAPGTSIQLGKNWMNLTTEEAMFIVRRLVEGCIEAQGDASRHGYVVTVDKFLKVLSIQLRLQLCLPIVLMSETGCGKTALVRILADALG